MPWFAPLHVMHYAWDFMTLNSYPNQVLKIEGVVLPRVEFLEYICPKQGQALKPSVATLFLNMGHVPSGEGLLCCSCLSYALAIVVVVFNEVSNVIQLLLFLLCLILQRCKSSI